MGIRRRRTSARIGRKRIRGKETEKEKNISCNSGNISWNFTNSMTDNK
jgi:hypothetical protein